tara:strand:- start:624 stop:797 length:174 start_codon:yes stop_codon:yes gene_type:complete
MRLIDRIIKKLEDDAVMYSSVGMDKEAKESRRLASKYTEMKYKGDVDTIKTEKDKNE